MTNRDKAQEICERAGQYYNDNIEPLIKIYGGRWVIIYEGRVVDSDTDEFELAKRAQGRGRFDLKYVTPMFQIPKTLDEYLESQKHSEDEHLEAQQDS